MIESVIMRLMDIMLAFPGILLALSASTILGPGLNTVMIAVGISAVPAYARLVRSSVMQVKAQAYVESARAAGASDLRQMLVHIIPNVTDDWQALVSRTDIDVIDVCTSNGSHYELSVAALQSGKHVLCEKPVAHNFRETLGAAELAKQTGLKTKLGFTIRYSPGVCYAAEMIAEGFVGDPYIFNGYEQNSQ